MDKVQICDIDHNCSSILILNSYLHTALVLCCFTTDILSRGHPCMLYWHRHTLLSATHFFCYPLPSIFLLCLYLPSLVGFCRGRDLLQQFRDLQNGYVEGLFCNTVWQSTLIFRLFSFYQLVYWRKNKDVDSWIEL